MASASSNMDNDIIMDETKTNNDNSNENHNQICEKNLFNVMLQYINVFCNTDNVILAQIIFLHFFVPKNTYFVCVFVCVSLT